MNAVAADPDARFAATAELMAAISAPLEQAIRRRNRRAIALWSAAALVVGILRFAAYAAWAPSAN